MHIVGFWTDVNRKGEPVEYVTVAPNVVEALKTQTHMRISEIKPREDEEKEAVLGQWEFIAEAYEAWKRGESIPDNGTPFAIWPGVSPENVKVLKQVGLRTVEEVAEMNETVMGKIRLPNVRHLKSHAAQFLDARGDAEVAVRLEDAEARNQQMADQIAALTARLETMQDQPEKRGPGRPRKDAAA